ncbi:MAG: hypothetical protein ACREDV_01345, partial [Methylocella sp.]
MAAPLRSCSSSNLTVSHFHLEAGVATINCFEISIGNPDQYHFLCRHDRLPIQVATRDFLS